MKRNIPIKTILAMALIGALACAGAWWLESRPQRTAQTSLRISEVMSDTDAANSDWIEIENTSEAEIRLYGYALVSAAEPKKAFVFPDCAIPANGFLVVQADGTNTAYANGQYHAPFRISSGSETIYLLNASSAAIDRVDVPGLGDGQVYALDADGNWQLSFIATPGAQNQIGDYAALQTSAVQVVADALEISEVSAKNCTFCPDENGECFDYVEIHNTSDEKVNLNGWHLSDDRANLRRWAFPGVELDADEYLIVHMSGLNRAADGHLHADFKLPSDGVQLYLTRSGGEIASYVSVPAMEADQAYSLTASGWQDNLVPSPGRANGVYEAQSARSVLYISEISATNSTGVDWIEIVNTSSASVDLTGWGLSDNAARPRKWQFPNGTVIQPGQYLLALADGDGKLDASARAKFDMPVADFSLSAAGGYSVVLSQPDGEIVDRLFVPEQYSDISYGRNGALAGAYMDVMTPGEANDSNAYQSRADAPVFSVRGGLLASGETLTVALSAPEDCQIYYTTDNTEPTERSNRYTQPITISEQTILRARAYRQNCLPSFICAESYLYDVKNGSGSVYTVSLSTEPDYLFNNEKGLYVEGTGAVENYYQEWEYGANVEIFDCEGNVILSQGCSFRLQGNATRREPQKGFKLIARNQYGESMFSGHIFTRRDYDICKSFLLRNSGDDVGKTRMRDSVLSALAADTSVLYQETEVCVVYLNGEYWGHYNLRETVNTSFICMNEGWTGDEDAIDLVVGDAGVLQGSDQTYLDLLSYLSSHDPNAQESYAKIDSAIDIQNYIEFMTLQIFTGNTDTLNIKRYRNPNADGKWRWILYDLDWGFSVDTNSFLRWLTPGNKGDGLKADNTFFIACMKNDVFRDRFLTYFGEQLATNLTSERVISLFKARYDLLTTILPDHFARWSESESRYNREVGELVEYAQNRPLRLLQFLKWSAELNLSRSDMEKYFSGAMEIVGLNYEQIPAL